MTTRVAVSAASSGNNTLVAAVSGRIIRVQAAVLVAAAAVVARFESDADGSPLTGQMSLTTTPLILPPNYDGWFETVEGELLNLELGTGVQVSGVLVYTLV